MAAEGSFRFEERIVAFVDVLGFSALVQRSEVDPAALASLADLIATNQLFERVVAKWLDPTQGAFFSDSFALSDGSPQHRAIYLIRETGYLCRYLLLHGLPCRGAITTGSLFHDGRFVVGPALVKAAELEKDVAVYPRIILDQASLEHWRFEVTDSATSELHSLVKRDHDGRHFLDLLDPKWAASFMPWTDLEPRYDPIPVDQAELLKRVGARVEQGFAESVDNQKVRLKYEWLAAQVRDHDAP